MPSCIYSGLHLWTAFRVSAGGLPWAEKQPIHLPNFTCDRLYYRGPGKRLDHLANGKGRNGTSSLIVPALPRTRLTSQGLAVGLGQCAAINYISEISPTRLRGSLLATYPLMVSSPVPTFVSANSQYTLGRFSATIAIQILVLTSPFRYRRVLYAQYFFVTCVILVSCLYQVISDEIESL